MDYLKSILLTVLAFFKDEAVLGLRFEDFVRQAVKPMVFAYVAGEYCYAQSKRLENFLQPKTPNFSIN